MNLFCVRKVLSECMCVRVCFCVSVSSGGYAGADRKRPQPVSNPLQSVAVGCSVVQCGAVWCSVVQRNAVCCRFLQCVAVLLEQVESDLKRYAACCTVLHCVALRALSCSVVQSDLIGTHF